MAYASSWCQEALNDICTLHAVGLYWVSWHAEVRGSETANGLVRNGSASGYVGPEPALGVSRQDLRNRINRWLGNQHQRQWRNLGDSRQARELILGPSQDTRIRLLSLTRAQSRVVTGLLTGHNTLHRHLHLMGLIDSPLCSKCGAEDETSAHILCRCEALASIRHVYLGSFFWSLRILRVKTWGPSGALARWPGSLERRLGHKGLVSLRFRCIGAERPRTNIPINQYASSFTIAHLGW
jgi:hypothetical protein